MGNWFFGGTGVNNLFGATADDTFFDQDGGAQFMYGGKGEDTADYSNASGSVGANLATGIGNTAGTTGTDFYNKVEDIRGSAFADRSLAMTITTNSMAVADNDVLTGGAGADHLMAATASTPLLRRRHRRRHPRSRDQRNGRRCLRGHFRKKSRMSKAAPSRPITGTTAITSRRRRQGDTLFGRGGDDTLNGDKGDDF